MSETSNSTFEHEISSQIFDELGGNYSHAVYAKPVFGVHSSMEKKPKKLYDGSQPKQKIEIVYPGAPKNVERDIHKKRKVNTFF